LIEKAKTQGLKLALTGHETDMPTAYKASDLTVCPSLQPEAFGRTAAEAQAMGTPVIAADHGGAREAVDHGHTGWRAQAGNIEAWKGAVRQALGQTRGARVAMALAARAHIAEKYSKRALQTSTLQVYSELITEPAQDS
jgi:glycosyltransferase involved in cell wall biosynthesis